MKLRLFLVLTFLFTTVFAANSYARKPAVEEFVGVETENYRPTTKGTEVLFNFGNHINSHEKNLKTKQKTAGWFATATLVAFVLLPFFMWIGITNTLKEEDEVSEITENEVHPTAQLENVKHLSDYKSDSNSDGDDIKKAS